MIDLVVGPRDPATKRGFPGVENSVRGLPREFRGAHVHLMRAVSQLELGQHDGRALETVGFDNIGAGLEICAMDIERSHPDA